MVKAILGSCYRQRRVASLLHIAEEQLDFFGLPPIIEEKLSYYVCNRNYSKFRSGCDRLRAPDLIPVVNIRFNHRLYSGNMLPVLRSDHQRSIGRNYSRRVERR